jgi:hypothetical protein
VLNLEGIESDRELMRELERDMRLPLAARSWAREWGARIDAVLATAEQDMPRRKGRKKDRYKAAPSPSWGSTKPRYGKLVDERRRKTRAQRKARRKARR